MMRDFLKELPFSPDGKLAFVAQRLELWTNVGAQFHPSARQEIGSPANGQAPRPATAAPDIPQAADWFVLKQWKRQPAGLVQCADSLGETVRQTAERLVKYTPFMVSAPTFDAAAASFVPSSDDAIFLSRNADGKAPWLEGTPNLFHMLDAAHVLGRSVESVLAQYPRYRFLGIHAPTASREELEVALPKDEADRLLLTGTLDVSGRRRHKRISFMLLLQTAVKTRRPLGYLLDRVRDFKKVGITSQPLDFEPTAHYQPEELDVRDLAYIRKVSKGIALGPLLAAVMTGGDTRLFATARRVGLLPVACSDEVLAGLSIDTLDVCILSRNGDGRSPWIGRKVPRPHISDLAKSASFQEEHLVRRVQRMAPLGVELLEVGELQVL